jgi:hypothetical protein
MIINSNDKPYCEDGSIMISQSQAKSSILELWQRFGAHYSTGIEFKNEKNRFELFVRDHHANLLDFKCRVRDAYLTANCQLVDGWINEFEKYPSNIRK